MRYTDYKGKLRLEGFRVIGSCWLRSAYAYPIKKRVSNRWRENTQVREGRYMLKHAEANLSALIESTHDLIWSVDLDYRLITFNRALQQNIQDTVGVRLAEGMLPKDFVPPERAGLLPPLYGRALAEGSFRDEFSLADDNILELTFNPIVVNGKAKGISVFGKDITKRKAAEDALHEAGEKYREIFEGALEGIFQT